VIVIDVLGSPAPKGSNRAMLRGGFAVMVPGSSDVGKKRMRSWERAVRDAALDACSVVLDRPVSVAVIFRLKRPKGHWTKRGEVRPSAPKRPSVKPDLDKLARTTLDALTGVAFSDDARIVELALHKTYAQPGHEGARIVVRECP
jgi:Holliday junction resolvase RusA-like endonuclease